MVLKATLDTLDGLPEAVHEHYVQRDGKYYLETDGLRTQADVDRLQSALNKERLDHKQAREQFKPISTLGLDVEQIVNMVNKYPELEIAAQGKIDDKKLEEIVNGRLKTATAPLERELGTLRTTLGERDTELNSFREERRINTIHSAIRAAAEKANVLPSAIEDALMAGERSFEIDETGRVVTKDGVGVTPGVDAAVWLTEIQPKRTHWWPASQGAGSGGRQGGGGGGNTNPFSHEHWNVTEQSRVYRESSKRAEDLARAAGTTLGGPRPAPRG
jgi:hypothetical protein